MLMLTSLFYVFLLLRAGVGGMNQMQMLMYYAQLGMMAQMNTGGGGMGMPGVPPAGALPNMPNMANPMMFPMMNPQQMAAFCASAQQQWQAGMPASTIANIAAAAAVAATAATNQDVSMRYACVSAPSLLLLAAAPGARACFWEPSSGCCCVFTQRACDTLRTQKTSVGASTLFLFPHLITASCRCAALLHPAGAWRWQPHQHPRSAWPHGRPEARQAHALRQERRWQEQRRPLR
jgi:hypothetical protein